MVIGINASAAFKSPRTGVEEYTFQLLKHLSELDVNRHQVILYVNKSQNYAEFTQPNFDKSKLRRAGAELRRNFNFKPLYSPFMWTQLRLGLEMLMHMPDVLFIPVHVLPLVHPRKSIVTIHGLEYEYFPEMYPTFFLRYLRFSTKYALKHAHKIIAVSENTKRDLIKLYRGDPKKIEVVHHGVNEMQNACPPEPSAQADGRRAKCLPARAFGSGRWQAGRMQNDNSKFKNKYILYLGRLEKKKNVDRLVRAFDILKARYKIPHKLILAGPAGYRFKEIEQAVNNSKTKDDIVLTGYAAEEKKWQLLKNADIFAFVSLYEGFGIPVLEAQNVGVPVVTSNASSLPEVVGESALKVNPLDIEEIAESIYKLISDDELREDLISRGYKNIKRFSWEKCAKETLNILIG